MDSPAQNLGGQPQNHEAQTPSRPSLAKTSHPKRGGPPEGHFGLLWETWCLGFEILGLGFEVLGLGFEVLGLGSAVLGLGSALLRLGFEVLALKPRSFCYKQ